MGGIASHVGVQLPVSGHVRVHRGVRGSRKIWMRYKCMCACVEVYWAGARFQI